MRQVRDSLYWVTDGVFIAMFLVAPQGVIVVDAPETLGPRLQAAIREVTDRPITHLVYSHSHADHIGGASLIAGPGVTIVAHRETGQILARRRDPRRPPPTVVFDGTYRLGVGGQVLELAYKGVNHEPGNLFAYAPRQRTLMLVDIVFPGWQPFKHLGIAEDVPGYLAAHDSALAYPFDTFVAGHVGRLGTRADVEESKAFATDLLAEAGRALASLPFGTFAASARAANTWQLLDLYQRAVVARCARALTPRWSGRLTGTPVYIADNCWRMVEAFSTQFAPPAAGGGSSP